jgi:glycosyltransferase involved in cell wall biosynthesis
MAGVSSPLCKFMKKKYIYEIASNALVNRELITKKNKEFSRSRLSFGTIGNWIDIKLANAIIVQNRYQKIMLKKNFDRECSVIKMPLPITESEKGEKIKPFIALWVGAISEVKQPELFLKLAEAIPEGSFQMIGGISGNKELYNYIKEKSKRLSNFKYLGTIPYDKINKYFSRASILVNTSMFEGFPHAFIQAWMNYMPVVSLNADPDGLICKNKLGFHSKTFDQLIEDVNKLLNNKQLREEIGRNAIQYVRKEHDVANVIKEYIDLFDHIGKS